VTDAGTGAGTDAVTAGGDDAARDVSEASPVASSRRRWSLQARLITIVVSMVSLILIVIGVALGTALRGILEENLNSQLRVAMNELMVVPGSTAQQILSQGGQQTGTVLVVRTFGEPTGAYVSSGGAVVALTADEMAGIGRAVTHTGITDVTFPGLGDYRVVTQVSPSGAFVILGLPTSAQAATLGRTLVTVGLLTAGGLLVLAAVIALVIRQSLRPLRAVADTATRVAGTPMAQGTVSITERVPDDQTDAHTEIGRVGLALNTLLDHVDASLTARQRNEERMRAFVADASHELRTPLASIRGYSELSLRALSQAPDAPATAGTTAQSLERIQAQSLRMTSLVEDLLLLARLDEGTELVYGTVDLTRLAIDAVSDARAAGAAHEWVLEVGDEPVVVAGDATRLHQVAANLLANARVHTPAGTRVTTSVSVAGGTASLRVHDDGPGVDSAMAGALFERFARADASRARKTGGTGLGLSIAKAIATAHGGSITVDSEPGSTTFEVRLPARPADPAQ